MTAQELLGYARQAVEQDIVQAVVVVVVGFMLTRVVGRAVQRQLTAGSGGHWGLIGRKTVSYAGSVLVLLALANVLGIDLTALIATAGVATVAIGFAAQTSLSNLIAGLFLLVDRPFKVGDTVELEGRLGIVQEISLLSTLVRTFDSILVRWPNEVVLKATILNYTRYPARRVDVKVGVAYGSDLKRARACLAAAISGLDTVLVEPAAEVVTRGLLDSAVELEVRAWVPQAGFLRGRTDIVETIHNTLKAEGIEIAFPQVTVWRGQPPTAPGDEPPP